VSVLRARCPDCNTFTAVAVVPPEALSNRIEQFSTKAGS